MKNTTPNVLGWIGVVLIMAGYLLVSFSVLAPTDIWYQILNALGALGIVIETYAKKDYQPLWLNGIWLLVAIVAMARILF